MSLKPLTPKSQETWWRGIGPETAGSIFPGTRWDGGGHKKKKKKARLKLSKRDPHEVKSQTPRECGAVGSQWGLPGPKRQDTSLTWLVTWKRNREHDLATNCPGRAATARFPPPLPAALGRDWRRAHLGIGLQRQPALTLHGRSARPLSSSDSRRRRRRRFRPRGPDLALSNLRPPGGVSED